MKTLFDILEKQGYFLIAEIGVNYYDIAKKEKMSNIDAAKMMCRCAKEAGADAVKFQTYKAEKIASKYSPSYWDTDEEPITSQYELFRKHDLFGEEEYHEIAAYCESIDVIFMSTPFDFEAADYLDAMMDYFKISSSDITNLPFIRHIAEKKKPILLSVGASSEEEIGEAVAAIQSLGNMLVLLHCVLEYPTPNEHANLNRIAALKEKYPDIEIGYSDHAKPDDYEVIKTAYALGARIIEKHFTLDKTLQGNDHYHAMDVTDLKNIKQQLEKLKMIIGRGGLDYLESENSARINARRSIVLLNDLKAGSIIQREDITFKRPGTGIAPKECDNVVGRCVGHDIKADVALKWSDLV